jgi:hypothetical protein
MDCIAGDEASWWIDGRHLDVVEPGARPPTITRYERLATPLDLAADFRRAYRAAGLNGQLRIELVASAGGSDGFFVPGLVVLGERDLRQLAQQIFMGPSFHRIDRHTGQILRLLGTVVIDREQLYRFVRGRILRHELGHAAFHESGVVAPYGEDEEASADYFAGQLDAIDGANHALGEIVFHAIGCREAICTHPRPPERAGAYLYGYQDQAVAQIAAA